MDQLLDALLDDEEILLHPIEELRERYPENLSALKALASHDKSDRVRLRAMHKALSRMDISVYGPERSMVCSDPILSLSGQFDRYGDISCMRIYFADGVDDIMRSAIQRAFSDHGFSVIITLDGTMVHADRALTARIDGKAERLAWVECGWAYPPNHNSLSVDDGLAWCAAGMNKAEAFLWVDEGFTVAEGQKWRDAKISASYARAWEKVGVDSSEAGEWIDCHARFNSPYAIEDFRANGVSVNDIRSWCELLGKSAWSAPAFSTWQDMQRLGITTAVADQLLAVGHSTSTWSALRSSLTYADDDEKSLLLEWAQAHPGINRVQMIDEWRSAGFSVVDAAEWHAAHPKLGDASVATAWIQAGYTSAQAAEWAACASDGYNRPWAALHTVEGMKMWTVHPWGEKAEDVGKFVSAGLSPNQVLQVLELVPR